jgi:hypothetical protein
MSGACVTVIGWEPAIARFDNVKEVSAHPLAESSMLRIAVINASTATADADVQKMIPAFDSQWNKDLDPIWGVGQAEFSFVPKRTKPASGSWWVVFLDDSDQANALAYHDLTNEGLPISKVFVKTIQSDNASVSVGASHEICEMAVDPWLNSAYQDSQGVFWAGEVCDPVEDDQYGYKINGILVSDFVTPNWFGHQHAVGHIDLKLHARAAFEVLSGGYAQKYDPQKGWQQVTGSQAARTNRGAHAAPGSRRERRERQWKNWERSAHHWENGGAGGGPPKTAENGGAGGGPPKTAENGGAGGGPPKK